MSSILSSVFETRKYLILERMPFVFFALLLADLLICETFGTGFFAIRSSTFHSDIEFGVFFKGVAIFVGAAVILGPIFFNLWDRWILPQISSMAWAQDFLPQTSHKLDDHPNLGSAMKYIISTDNQVAYGEHARLLKAHNEARNTRTFVFLSLSIYLIGAFAYDANEIAGSTWSYLSPFNYEGSALGALFVVGSFMVSGWFIIVYLLAYSFHVPRIHLPGYADWVNEELKKTSPEALAKKALSNIRF
ncbi:MAG: hypothetical protein HWE25_14295 [Alphaproteobacteria bacterium]|nr:hypothetical protein [Alphaproteobacteria bacterium]